MDVLMMMDPTKRSSRALPFRALSAKLVATVPMTRQMAEGRLNKPVRVLESWKTLRMMVGPRVLPAVWTAPEKKPMQKQRPMALWPLKRRVGISGCLGTYISQTTRPTRSSTPTTSWTMTYALFHECEIPPACRGTSLDLRSAWDAIGLGPDAGLTAP